MTKVFQDDVTERQGIILRCYLERLHCVCHVTDLDVRITKLTLYRVPPRWMFLKVETDEGVTGWGEPVIEGRARTVEAAVNELATFLIGQDPLRINDLWQVMYRGGFYRGGAIFMSAIAGLYCGARFGNDVVPVQGQDEWSTGDLGAGP